MTAEINANVFVVKLLCITEDIPNVDPAFGDGSSLISHHVVMNLPPSVQIDVITFTGAAPLSPELVQRCERIEVLAKRTGRVSEVQGLAGVYPEGSTQRWTPQARRLIDQWSRTADVCLVHGPHLLRYTQKPLGAPVVYQSVDPWSLRRQMEAQLVTGWRRAFRSAKARAVRYSELRIDPQVTLLTVSPDDARRWSQEIDRPVSSISNGVVLDDPVHVPRQEGTVAFVGSLDYGPNVESVQVLARDFAPRLWRHNPNIRFIVAGRNPGPEILSLASDRFEVRGNVPSVAEIFASCAVAVFPDQSGLGIRNSVTEALACRTPVVATTVAARGQQDHRLLHRADDLDEVVRTTIRLLDEGNRFNDDDQSSSVRTWAQAAGEYYAVLEQASQKGSSWPAA